MINIIKELIETIMGHQLNVFSEQNNEQISM